VVRRGQPRIRPSVGLSEHQGPAHCAFALPADPRYREAMAEANRIDFDNPTPIDADEDGETLAAIDEGIRDARDGRTVPMEEVRRLLPNWITASSSRKEP
jgi:hypothetical protein